MFAMPANAPPQDNDLIVRAVAWLNERLPEGWTAERSSPQMPSAAGVQLRSDSAIDVRAPNHTTNTFAVEARASLEPREVEQLLPRLAETLRSLAGYIPLLVVAPWLSARTRELLAARAINYIDLTGNALISLSNPAIYINSSGAARNPSPAPRGRALVKGPRAARLIRVLADVRPPYGVREIALATQLTPGYVSRLLDALDREALLQRSRRGAVESVDVPGLLRRWADSYDVLKTNSASTFIAPNGAGEILERLAAPVSQGRRLITGSFAAVRTAPVAAPALLLVYCDDPAAVARELRLLPADEGANVALLSPFDPVVWERCTQDGGLRYAATSQVVVDCLTGTGRMPAEGEALLEWMQVDESRWRWDSLERLRVETAT
jgi:hypothetical protein